MSYFILVQDTSSHWFVIPDNQELNWSCWCDLD